MGDNIKIDNYIIEITMHYYEKLTLFNIFFSVGNSCPIPLDRQEIQKKSCPCPVPTNSRPYGYPDHCSFLMSQYQNLTMKMKVYSVPNITYQSLSN